MRTKACIIVTIALAALVGLGALIYFSHSAPDKIVAPTQEVRQKPVEIQNLVRWHSPAFGNRSSPVLVVEWFDPECEGCRAFHPTVEKIMAEYANRVHFVFRYMPFHSNSLYAASVLEETREFGKFSEALNLMFETQPQWGNHHKPQPDLIPAFLEKLGIPKEKLERSYVIQKHGAKIKIDEDDGLKAGVTGTPTFFVNGQKVSKLGEDSLRSAINTALSQAK